MKKKLAVIGAGGVARGCYLPYFKTREDVELLICSLVFSEAEQAAGEFGGKAFRTIDALMAEEPDAVFVLTMEMQHLDVADEVLRHPARRLFIEKPLSARKGQANVTEEDYFEAAEFLKRAEAAGCQVAMNFNYRFFDLSRKLRQIVEERSFGILRQSSWFVNYACWSHCIDLLHCFGGGVKTVSALGEPVENADLAGAFTLENGGTGVIIGTNASAFRLPLYHVVLNFEKGTVTFADLDSELKVYDAGTDYCESFRLIPDLARWAKYNASFAASLAAYLESIDNNAPPPVSGKDGLRELQFEAALRRSAAGRRPVELKEMVLSE